MPYNYAISFRVANRTIGGRTYDERRQSIIDGARGPEKMGFWDETTSFILVESNLQTDAIAKAASRGLVASADMLFVFDPSDESACYFGAVEHVDVLRSFFPKLKKVD